MTSSPAAGSDARRSFHALRGYARTLAGFSASFAAQAREATAAYREALTAGSPESWRRFVAASAALAVHGEALDALAPLDDGVRIAWHFFKQIADENADLLDARTLAVA